MFKVSCSGAYSNCSGRDGPRLRFNYDDFDFQCRCARRAKRARASGELAYHVLDLMHAFHDASNEGRHVELQSTCERPAPLPLGLHDGEIDS